MKKLFLFLCLSTSLAYAMDPNLPITNPPSVDIDSPSLGNNIVDTLGHSGVIVLETANHPDDDFFTVMRAIVTTQREARIQREARMHEYKQYTATIITLGVLAAFTILKNING